MEVNNSKEHPYRSNQTPEQPKPIQKVIRGTRSVILKIMYSKMGDENRFGLTPYGRRILGGIGYVDQDLKFVIQPRYAAVSDFTDDGLVRCGLPDRILGGVFMDEIRNHVGELLEIVEFKDSNNILLRASRNSGANTSGSVIPVTRKASAFITVSHKIPYFVAGWEKEPVGSEIKDLPKRSKDQSNMEDVGKMLFKTINGSRQVKRKPVSRPEILECIINDSITRHKPIPIFQYWGMGARNVPGRFEDSCFQNLEKTFQEIRKIHKPGLDLSLIFCDTHMEINGFGKKHRNSYLKELIPMARSYGWKVISFSELMKKSPKDFHIEVLENVQNFPIPEEIRNKLFLSASKKPVRDDHEDAAREYWTANVLERKIIEEHFRKHIFLTFNEPIDDILFSDSLCVLHWFPIKKGITDKPWFREE